MTTYQKILLSFFYSGYSPKMPGTIGSIAALPLVYLFWNFLNTGISTIFFVALLTHSFRVISKVNLDSKDPSWIVIDEVLGIFLGMICLFSFQCSFLNILILFISFRVFDILKPPFVSTFDKMNFPEAIIIDDLVAGIYAGITSFILISYLN